MNTLLSQKHVDITQKDYHQKVQIIKSIFSQYEKAKQEIDYHPTPYHSPLFVKERNINYGEYEHHLLHRISKINNYQMFIDYIDHKIQYLNETEQLIIQNDFISKKQKKWWDMYFSSATYYRHKKKAIEHLILLLFS